MKGVKDQDIKDVLKSQQLPELPQELENLVMTKVYQHAKKRTFFLSISSIVVYSVLASVYVCSVVFLGTHFGTSVWFSDLQIMLQLSLVLMVVYHILSVLINYLVRRSAKNLGY